MKTINNAVNISGKGLMKGLDCNVNIFPSETKGIKFFVSGSKSPILADYKNIISTDNCITLGNSENSMVILVEHFMAACAFTGIDSLDVCLDCPELPILDGSSKEWIKLLMEAGGDENGEIEQVSFERSFGISDNKTDLALIPAQEFKITYCVNFDHPQLQNRWAFFDLSQDRNQIVESRTFGYLKDLEKFQKAGLALGVTEKNTVGLTETGYTTGLRSDFEPIKHKILDLLGDLYLTGFNPLGFKAHIIAKDAGHRIHAQFAELLVNELKICVS